MKRKIIIQGMHCFSCENKVKDELSKIKNLKCIKVNAGKGFALIEYENIDEEKIKNSIEKLDYIYI
ncbi:MAG: heavy-metal-associated domain-containing protein [Bacilli bacterium]